MKRLISILLTISLVFSVGGMYAEASFHEDADAIAAAAESVLMLYCYNEEEKLISSGSGFLAIAEGIVITNFHVIDGDVAFVDAITEDGEVFPITELLCADPTADIAILRTTVKTGLPMLSLGDSSSLKKGSRVVAIGSPKGFLNTVSEGIYSSEIQIDETTYILFSAAISHGSSGGALFDDSGSVIGVTSATYEEGQNLNFAIPINIVKQLWKRYQNENNAYIEENSGNSSQSQKVESTPKPTPKPTPAPTLKPTPEPVIPWAETVKVGDYIKFGSYEQDNNIANGKEPIEWQVLDVQAEKALLISKYALDNQRYNDARETLTWESCTLRTWLNDAFLNDAFDIGEQRRILMTTVNADKNPDYSTDPGKATQDKIFLLSITEVNKYFTSNSERACAGTAYCYAQGADESSDSGKCWWWLRSPGYYSNIAAIVTIIGAVFSNGYVVDYDNIAVRPALWVDLRS